LANAAIYTLEGDEVNASISLVALWPLGGQFATGTRLVFKVVKTASNRSAKLIFNRTASGLFEFCNDKKAGGIVNCRGQLARMFSYNKATHQAHHMIPWGKRNHPLIQKAAEGGLFHPNMKANGEILSKSVHNGNHPGYDSVIQSYFDSKFTANLNPEDAAEIVFDAIDQLKAQLKNGIPINNVVIN